MATAVDDLAKKTPGKEALAIEGFARALRALPTAIADNAGLDSAELVSQLRAAHVSGNKTAGIGTNTFFFPSFSPSLSLILFLFYFSC